MIDPAKYEELIDKMASVYISAASADWVDDAISDLAEELLGEVGVDGTIHSDEQATAYDRFMNYVTGQAYLRAGLTMVQVGEAEVREVIRAGAESVVVEYTVREEEPDEGGVR